MSVSGKLYPKQFLGGFPGLLCLLLSGFAFVGAEKHGKALRAILEGENESTESKVLAAAGPTGPPGAGPTGPPGAGPSGPPGAGPTSPPSSVPNVDSASDAGSMEGQFIPAENGFFFKQMPDGSYEQTVYVQNEDGTYHPHEE